MTKIAVLTIGATVCALAGAAQAGVSPQEAAQLGGAKLTAFGAEKAGSADGSIPPYTGGVNAMSGLPTPTAIGDGAVFPDPFADEKPIATISKANVSKYANDLTPGVKALVERFPGFNLNVYQSHRTASYPDWVLENTKKNATRAELTGEVMGDGVSGAFGGIPFPIPKSGYEVMWNNFLHWQPAQWFHHFHNAMVDSSGGITDLGEVEVTNLNPYYNPKASSLDSPFPYQTYVNFLGPITSAGDQNLFLYPINYSERDQTTWFYSPGLRRVRLAPEFTYDTPIANYGGALTYDEIVLFSGRMDRFDFKLKGKKEVIIPYNCYRMNVTTTDQSEILKDQYLNPEFIRWEKHRVWVVDATLKPGLRHTASRKTFYIDEDSWKIIASETYDQGGQFYRVMLQYPYTTYGDKETAFFPEVYGAYDLSKGNYFIAYLHSSNKDRVSASDVLPDLRRYSPESMSSRGLR